MWAYNFLSVSYENEATERLAEEFSYETAAFLYENASRRCYFRYGRDRRALFSYRELAKLQGRVAGRRLAAAFSYGNAKKLYAAASVELPAAAGPYESTGES
ncbi:MAG: hypothetical protein QOF89_4277 [Acidobacteriota bacterium]|jgi:hypothetical protein|nr:hypothetical protein [Acidobacteriota bacterium]